MYFVGMVNFCIPRICIADEKFANVDANAGWVALS